VHCDRDCAKQAYKSRRIASLLRSSRNPTGIRNLIPLARHSLLIPVVVASAQIRRRASTPRPVHCDRDCAKQAYKSRRIASLLRSSRNPTGIRNLMPLTRHSLLIPVVVASAHVRRRASTPRPVHCDRDLYTEKLYHLSRISGILSVYRHAVHFPAAGKSAQKVSAVWQGMRI
jgi:hypothetical protein